MAILYARRSWKLAGQIAADVFVVGWLFVWAALGLLVHSVIAAVAAPVGQAADAVQRVSQDFRSAADRAAQVPAVGDQLRRPFDDAVQRLDAVVVSAHQQVEVIERAALVLGWLTFVIPVLVVVLVWLPRRIRFAREAQAAQRLLDDQSDLDLFALRALATQPITRLVRVSPEPMVAWRSGD